MDEKIRPCNHKECKYYKEFREKVYIEFLAYCLHCKWFDRFDMYMLKEDK